MRQLIIIVITFLCSGSALCCQIVNPNSTGMICEDWYPIYCANSAWVSDLQACCDTWTQAMNHYYAHPDYFKLQVVTMGYVDRMPIVQSWDNPADGYAGDGFVLASECRLQGGGSAHRAYKITISVNDTHYSICTGDPVPCPDNMLSLQAVLMHELGHFIGAGHASPLTICACPTYASMSAQTRSILAATMSSEQGIGSCADTGFLTPRAWAATLSDADRQIVSNLYQRYINIAVNVMSVATRNSTLVVVVSSTDTSEDQLQEIRACIVMDGQPIGMLNPVSVSNIGANTWELVYGLEAMECIARGADIFVELNDGTLRGPYCVTEEQQARDNMVLSALKSGEGIRISVTSDNSRLRQLVIYDLRGRRCINYDIEGRRDASVIWDFTDEAGRRVPSGVYIVKCKMESGGLTRSVAVVR